MMIKFSKNNSLNKFVLIFFILLLFLFGPNLFKMGRDLWYYKTVNGDSYKVFKEVQISLIKFNESSDQNGFRNFLMESYVNNYAIVKLDSTGGPVDEYVILNTPPDSFPSRGCHLLFGDSSIEWRGPDEIEFYWKRKVN